MDEHTDRIAPAVDRNDARRGTDPALEAEADHSGPAADIALLDRPVRGLVQRRKCRLRRDVKTFEIVEIAAPGLGNDRPGGASEMLRIPLLNAGIDLANPVCVGDPDGSLDDPEIVQIGAAGHLTVAIEVEEAAIDGPRIGLASREDDRDTGADRPDTDFERPLAFDQRFLSHLDAANIRDRVQWTSHAFERNAEIAAPGVGRRRNERQQGERSLHSVAFTRPDSIVGSSRGIRASGSSSRPRAHLCPE